MAAKEFCNLSGISTVRPTLENMEKTTSLSGPEQPSLSVTATLPFLTLTGVLGIDLTILRAGCAVTWRVDTRTFNPSQHFKSLSFTLLMARLRSLRVTPAMMETQSLSGYLRLSSDNLKK